MNAGENKLALLCCLPYIIKPQKYLILTQSNILKDQLKTIMDPAQTENYYQQFFDKKCVASLSKGIFNQNESTYHDVTIVNVQALKDYRKMDPKLFDLIAFDQNRGSITTTFINICSHFNLAKLVFVNCLPFLNVVEAV